MPPRTAALSGPRCDDSEPTALPESSIETDAPPESTAPIIEPKLPPGALSTPAALAPLWSRVIRAASPSPLMRAILMNSTLASVGSGLATIIAPPRYASGAPKFLPQISDLLTKEHGSPLKALVRSADPTGSIELTPAAPPDSEPTDSTPDPMAQQTPAPRPTPSNLPNATNHPLVQHALALFGGRIVGVQPRKPN